MPLVIKELHVKMVVEENGNHSNSKPMESSTDSYMSEDRLIEKCVRAVLQVLADKNDK